MPLVAIEGAIGDWVVGAGAMTSARSERQLRRPGRIPPSDFGNTFEYRYAGHAGSIRRDTLMLGGARRLGGTVAIGMSIGASRVEVNETRRLWAGDARTATPGDPTYDAEIPFASRDNFSPSVIAGVLVAPEDSRIELAGSIAWSAPARTVGSATAAMIGLPRRARGAANAVSVEVDHPLNVLSHHSLKAASCQTRIEDRRKHLRRDHPQPAR